MKEKELEFYEDQPVPDKDIRDVMEEEIANAPQAPCELEERISEHNASSPADSGGDIDATWEEATTTGAETVFGHNPTPDQSDVEANAHAMGINYEDNETLDFEEKIEQRDRNRFELNESSKTKGDSI